MKKLLCISVVLFTAITAFPQNGITKGYWLVDGMGHYNSITQKNTTGSISDLSINPRIGYFVRDQLAIGAGFEIVNYKEPSYNAFTTIGIEPFVRYYAFNPKKDFNLYADVKYSIGRTGTLTKRSSHQWTAAVGGVAFLNKHTGLEVNIFYSSAGGEAYPNEFHHTGGWIGLQSHTDCGEHKNSKNRPAANISNGDWLADLNIQTSEGRFNRGGLLSGGFLNSNSEAKLNFGYFFMDRLAGGLKLGWESQKLVSSSNAYQQVSVDPYVRYYFFPATKVTNIFGHLSYGVGSEGTKNSKDGYNSLGVKGGLAHFLNEHTALEATLNYKHYEGELYADPENRLGIRVALQVHLDGNKAK